MQFLKILFWCLLAFVAALFTYGNWNAVPIHLWSGLIADVNLPLLLLVTFLLGFVPAQLYNLAIRWRLRQRLATSERTVADLRLAMSAPLAPAPLLDPGVEPVDHATAPVPEAASTPSASTELPSSPTTAVSTTPPTGQLL